MEFVNKTKRLYVRPSNCDEKGKFAAVLVQGGSKREIVKRVKMGGQGSKQ